MSQTVSSLPRRNMQGLHNVVHASLHRTPGKTFGQHRVLHGCPYSLALVQRSIAPGDKTLLKASKDLSVLEQPRATRKPCSDQAKAAAARYASARHLVTQHQLAHQKIGEGNSEHLVNQTLYQAAGLEQQMPETGFHMTEHLQQQQQQQFCTSKSCEDLTSQSPCSADLEQSQTDHVEVPQQLLDHVSRTKELNKIREHQKHLQHFSTAVALYDVHARSDRWVDWQQAALGLQRLVKKVNGPLQAQQVWQVATVLQAQPLLKQHARVLGGAVVELVKVSLRKHDPSVLRALTASQGMLRFSFSKRHMDKLLTAAVAADVSLEELQGLLSSAPRGTISNRSYFILIKAFMARQQFTEAAHCFQQMDNLGLQLTPALQQIQQQLFEFRAGSHQQGKAN